MRIVKKKKGKLIYYYLKYSFRVNNKITTKEKYLGKKIPSNLDKIKQNLENESKKFIYAELEKIRNNFQIEWQKIPERIKEKEKENIAVSFTFNTNAIEGSKITLPESKLIIENKIAPNKSLNDIKETENHAKTFLKILNTKEKIEVSTLLRWHNEIFNETKNDIAGRFRDYLVRVGNYVAPDWQDVNNLMKELIVFIHNSKLNSVELAAIVHYRFEMIHPFGDGNGRIGRLLINYILWNNKFPMLIIENKKKIQYYKALQKDEEGFLRYFLRLYIKVHKRYLQNAN